MKPGISSPFLRRPLVILILGAVLLLLLALVLYLGGFFQPVFDATKLGSAEYDVTYCTMDGVSLGMDIYYPDSGGPWPVLVFVHGGGWMEGDKAGVLIMPTDSGFLVASINYRMYPDYQFPAMIEDVKCAIRFLRAHARQYNLDPEHIALAGHSAGGHLVALAGLADKSAGWDVGQYLGQSSRAQAVVVIAGPADLTRPFSEWVNDLLQNVFGPEQLISGSPVTYASSDDPPFLIIHGNADPVVPAEQAYLLDGTLLRAGISSELVIIKNAGHGLEPVGNPISPSGEAIYQEVIKFLERLLNGTP